MHERPVVVIATRQSRLALWQAEHVRSLLKQRSDIDAELLGITTSGDRILDRSLAKVGGKGLFVKELENALDDGSAQLAVHSLKDVPMELPSGFALAAVLERDDARDAFVANRSTSLDALPRGARVGTSSLRRMTQLLNLRPDLAVEPLRGNVDTRLRKLDEGHYDAIVLAAAGLKRLGLDGRIRALFDVETMIPAAGQGALGIEIRSESRELHRVLAALTHSPTELAVHAERAVSRSLGGSCSTPLAAYASWHGGQLVLDAALGDAAAPAAPLMRARVGPCDVADEAAAVALGRRAAEELLAQGAGARLRAH